MNGRKNELEAGSKPNYVGEGMIADWRSTGSADWLDNIFEEFSRESRTEVLRREKETFDQLGAPVHDSILLFGAGPLGRYAAQGLRQARVGILAFADNNPRLWGTTVEGLEVLSPEEASRRYREVACFVVTIYNGSGARRQLRDIGCKRVVPFAPLFWKYSEILIPGSYLDLPHTILDREEEIRLGYGLLSDEASRQVFCEALRWRFLLDYACLSSPQHLPDIYFPPDLVSPREEEVFVDCGAFDGDSIRAFLAKWPDDFKRILAIEADPGNMDALRLWIRGLRFDVSSRITTLPYAVGDRDSRVSFRITNTMGSTLLGNGADSTIECRKLDTLLAGAFPTYIKMDIEGAEPQAIAGAHLVLRQHSPVLAVCVYHRCEHMWQLPVQIHSIVPDHRLFLRRYAEECWESVCYAIPPDRLRGRT
jgi:FkbM family methyltransferase